MKVHVHKKIAASFFGTFGITISKEKRERTVPKHMHLLSGANKVGL